MTFVGLLFDSPSERRNQARAAEGANSRKGR
jgi:hypothetical protein